ncbi:AMP-binding protein [Pseudoalteromonas xiamenensis]
MFIQRLLQFVAQSPTATALICGDRHYSYEQLAMRAVQIHRAISALNLAESQAVLIDLPKSFDAVAAIYASWMSGLYYVPLDYSQPDERKTKIRIAAKPSLVIDDVWLTLNCSQELNLDEQFDLSGLVESKLACVLYTSGSTGTPKGVQITHAMLSFFVDWAVQDTHLSASDVLSNHASFAFDLSTFDLFAAVSVGASVWVIQEHEQKDPSLLIEGIARHQVSVWYSVPSMLVMLEKSGQFNVDSSKTLREVIFAGEPYPVGLLQRLIPCLTETCRLSNWYGPTETNVCTAYEVPKAQLESFAHLPIGMPLPGLKGYIEDEYGERYPVSTELRVQGELLIEGPCVTPGYRNITLPRVSKLHKEHVHPTGDLVEQTEEGLVYRGRIDQMVKINGYRVELGEIEAALHRHADILHAAVYVELGEMQQKLVAVIEQAPDTAKLSLLSLKRFLSEHLPPYMLIHKVIVTSQLPLNANGKVERKRLSEVEPA